MRYYCFPDVNERFSPDLLDPPRVDLFALCDEEGNVNWHVPLQNDEEARKFAQTYQLGPFSIVELQDCVDWGMQWSLGRQEGQEGGEVAALERLTLDLKRICPIAKEGTFLTLLPGPGFGDLSHPTTRLSLKMLAPLVGGVDVWDIGCGSGILGLAALKLGARAVYGIDIDLQALEHAERNALENGLSEHCTFWTPQAMQKFPEIDLEAIVVMNMIRSEQESVWQHFPALSHFRGRIITSGILRAECQLYRTLCMQRGFCIEEERFEGDWMAFHLKSP